MALTQIDDRGLKTPIDLLDNEKIRFGTGNDLEIYHSSSPETFIANTHGSLTIKNTGNINLYTNNNEDAVVCRQNGAVELYYDNAKKLNTESWGVTVSGDIKIGDSKSLLIGDGNDLQIFHNGFNSKIADVGTGALILSGSTVKIENGASSENQAVFTENGAVELYYDNSKKAETNGNGLNVTGRVYCSGHDGYGLIIDDNVMVAIGNSNDLQLKHDGSVNKIVGTGAHDIELYTNNTKRFTIQSNGNTVLVDDAKLFFGTGSDLRLWHDGSNSYILNTTGALIIRGAGGSNYIHLEPKTDENGILIKPDGAVELYYDNAKKLDTFSQGVNFYGSISGDNGDEVRLGTGDDLILKHDGSNSYIDHSGNGNLYIRTLGSQELIRLNAAKDIELRVASGNEHAANFKADGAVELYYDGSKKFETLSGGAKVSGKLEVDSGTNQHNTELHVTVNEDVHALNIIHGGVAVSGNPTRTMVEWRNFNNEAIAEITSNSSTITYGTGSDYRMKENQVGISDGITRIKQLKPYRFNWKSEYGGGDKVDGFFAHEAATVVPESVLGVKDAVDSDGNIIRQQIDQAKLIPLLTAALQEAITKIETLETEVAALKG